MKTVKYDFINGRKCVRLKLFCDMLQVSVATFSRRIEQGHVPAHWLLRSGSYRYVDIEAAGMQQAMDAFFRGESSAVLATDEEEI